MDDNTLISQLEELADSLAIQIRYEPLRREGSYSAGGLCKLKGEYVVIINANAGTRDKIDALARSVARFDLSRIYLKPGLREFLDPLTKKAEPLPEEQ